MDNNDSGRRSFADNLMTLLNKHSMDNRSDTPDYILCGFLVGCMKEFEAAVKSRDEHAGKESKLDERPQYNKETEHPDYPLRDWRTEVNNGYTILGYRDWVCHCIERDSK